MQISKKIPFDDPNVLNGVRALYIISNIIIAGIYFYVQQQINKKNGVYRHKPALWSFHNLERVAKRSVG
jgi:hypothetical protein